MGVHISDAITVPTASSFSSSAAASFKKPIKVQVIIKLGTTRCALIVNKDFPTANASKYFCFVPSALLCLVIKTTSIILSADGRMLYPWMNTGIRGV